MNYEDNTPIHSLSNRDAFIINNSFNRMKSQLSQLSMDLFFLLITQVTKEHDALFLYQTSMSEIQRIFNRRIKQENMQNSIEELLTYSFELNINDEIITTSLLSTFEYDSGTIQFKLNDNLIDILINQKTRYTVASLQELVSLKSVYAKRIYLLLKQFATSKEFIMHLSDIYKILNLENKYERYSHFKNRILNPAIRSINKQTSLEISIYEHLKNQTVQRIKFNITSPLKQAKVKSEKMSDIEKLNSWLDESESRLSQNDPDKLFYDEDVKLIKPSNFADKNLLNWVNKPTDALIS